MKVVFLGTPELAVPSLDAIHRHHDVALVVTQPDRPRGRGRRLGVPAVKRKARELGLDWMQPESLDGPETLRRLQSTGADILAVVAYGLKVPDAILATAPCGAVNLHFSLLPAYRGAAPLNWAIIRGEEATGITTFRLTAQMDAGPIYLQERTAILPGETAGELGSRLAAAGGALFLRTLDGIEDGSLAAMPQDDSAATKAPKLSKADGRIAWSRPAAEIINLVRGVNPWPGAYTTVDGEILKVWRADLAGGKEKNGPESGTVIVASPKLGLVVAAGEGMVLLTEVQARGARRMGGRDYLAGHALKAGTRLV